MATVVGRPFAQTQRMGHPAVWYLLQETSNSHLAGLVRQDEGSCGREILLSDQIGRGLETICYGNPRMKPENAPSISRGFVPGSLPMQASANDRLLPCC